MRFKAIAVLFALLTAVIVSLIALMISVALGQQWLDSMRFAGAAFATVFALGVSALSFLDFESPAVRESRERVRQAGLGLEAVLSTSGGPPSEGQTEPQDNEHHETRDLALARLWALTQSQLELYHKIATQQARLSFWSAQVAMTLGFALLGVFVAVALQASTTAGAIVAGGLGAVSAALAGFVGKTFVRSQETAAGHLKAYFDQPLEFSRYLAAERLVRDSGMDREQRAAVTAELAKAIVAGPGGPVAAGGTEVPPGGGIPQQAQSPSP
ncbi:TRADD-N-associated membrane domain-containing protein [Streptomyces chartreusis]|uniref:TRADD-N-associated membrane domain-containing protein n=1 Tax=Streptomyces chartreusis TaxID=1969 RepID=UPI0036BFAD0D